MAIDTTLDQVEALYIGYFGRAGEPDGVNYWVGQLNNGYSVADMAASFSVQPEAKAEYPFLNHPDLVTDPGGFVDAIYQNLFHRAPDTDGKAYWVKELLGRGGDAQAIGQFILDVISGAKGDDITTLDNKVDAGTYYTQQLADAGIGGTTDGHLNANLAASADAAVGTVTSDPATVTASHTATDTFVEGGGASAGDTFVLTPYNDFADTVQSGRGGPNWLPDTGFKFTDHNETVQATNVTLQQGDSLSDGSTTDHDVLNVAVSGDISGISSAVVANLEDIHLTLNKAYGDFDLTNYTGVQHIDATGSVAKGDYVEISGFANSGVASIDTSGVTTSQHTDWLGHDAVYIADSTANQNLTIHTGTAGTSSADTYISVGNGDNTITTGNGDNYIYVGTGDNHITTGSGNDLIVTNAAASKPGGDNVIDAGDGVNQVYLQGDGNANTADGNATVKTGAGVDTVVVNNDGNNNIDTGAGVDHVTVNGGGAGDGHNIILTGAGNDTIALNAGHNTVTAGAGVDTITIGAASFNELVFHAGDSGITTATLDTVTGFDAANHHNTINFDSVAGSATNYAESNVAVADYAAALAAANAAFSAPNSHIEYFFADDNTNGWVFHNDGNGAAVMAVSLMGVTHGAFGFDNIVATATA